MNMMMESFASRVYNILSIDWLLTLKVLHVARLMHGLRFSAHGFLYLFSVNPLNNHERWGRWQYLIVQMGSLECIINYLWVPVLVLMSGFGLVLMVPILLSVGTAYLMIMDLEIQDIPRSSFEILSLILLEKQVDIEILVDQWW